MINKDDFVKVVNHLKRDMEYSNEMSNLTRKYNQDNCYHFTDVDTSFAVDILLRHALDYDEDMIEMTWCFIGDEVLLSNGDCEFKLTSAEELYDYLVR